MSDALPRIQRVAAYNVCVDESSRLLLADCCWPTAVGRLLLVRLSDITDRAECCTREDVATMQLLGLARTIADLVFP